MKVYRLITRNSYEREMFDKASLKLGLDKAVLQDINRKGSLNGVTSPPVYQCSPVLLDWVSQWVVKLSVAGC